MRAHLIENGRVTNTIEVDSLDFLPGLVDASLGGKIGDAWDGESFAGPPLSLTDLEELRDTHADLIRAEAEQACTQPVTLPDGSVWRGGDGSAQSIKGAVDMAEFAGLTTITLRDAARQPHDVDLNTARQIAAAIGLAYQQKFQAKEDALLALEQIDLSSPTAKAEIEAVTLPA